MRLTQGDGKGYEFTSQLFFTDAQADEIFTAAPYNSKGKRNLLNAGDGIYQQSGGQTLVTLTKSGSGYAGTFDHRASGCLKHHPQTGDDRVDAKANETL